MNTPSVNNTKTQKTVLFEHLMKGNHLTVLTALQLFGVYALSQRLGELRRNHNIPVQSKTIELHNGKRISEYWLEPEYITFVQQNNLNPLDPSNNVDNFYKCG